MTNYSKYPDVNAVLNKAESDLIKIEIEYNNSLNDQKINDILLTDIKDFFGNLRSAVDYLNSKIPNADNNFPITDHLNDFAKRYLAVAPDIRNVVEKWQPYHNNNDWIKWFNILNNKYKHISLVPQIRKEIVETRVSGQGGSVSWGSGVTFGSGVSIMGVPIDPNTQLPIPSSVVKTEKITWVHFLFDNSLSPDQLPSDISALPFLKMCFEKIVKIIPEIEVLIN